MAKFFSILFTLLTGSAYTQIDSSIVNSFERLSYSLSTQNLEYNVIYTGIDSIQIEIKRNPDVIITNSYFFQSKRSIVINYYFKNCDLYFITTSEVCPSKPGLTCKSRYYIVANAIDQQDHSSSKLYEGPRTFEEMAKEHYCPERFDYDFLEKYVWELFKKAQQDYP